MYKKEFEYFRKHNYAKFAPPSVEEQARNYFPRKFFINSVLIITGTIICGYGDLTPEVIKMILH